MPLSTIVTVIVRLFALYWAATALLSAVSIVGLFPVTSSFAWGLVSQLILPGFYLSLATIAWFCSASISRKVLSHHNPTLQLFEIRVHHFYALGFLVLGLGLFLKHIASMFQWVHYLIMNRAGQNMINGSSNDTLYGASSEFIPGILGFLLAYHSPRLGMIFAKKTEREENLSRDARMSPQRND